MTEQLEIIGRDEVTPDVVTLALKIPHDQADAYLHKPGQFIMVHTDWQGEDITRSYSICSKPGNDSFNIAVKRVEDGLISNHIIDTLAIGDKITVSKPLGLFRNHQGHRHVFFAAGSGITPIFSMLQEILTADSAATATLFYGNRESADIIFLEALQNLKDKYVQRFTLVFLLSKQRRDLPHMNGRLDREKIATFIDLGLIPMADNTCFYICGPGDMTVEITHALEEKGANSAAIFSEEFIAQYRPTALQSKKPAAQKSSEEEEAAIAVSVSLNGMAETVKLTDSHPDLLDAARANGIGLPLSCRGGMCGTCRCQVKTGHVKMASNYALEDWEIEQGFVLSCQINKSSIDQDAGDLAIEFDTT